MEELKNVVYINGLAIIDFQEITKSKLLVPEMVTNFHSIQDDDTPIFYYMVLKKV